MMSAKKFWMPCLLPIAFIACGGKPHTEWNTPQPKIHSFKAEPDTITEGETAKLTASFEGLSKISPGDDAVANNVPIDVTPKETTEYTLTVKNGDWEAAVSKVTVKVLKAPDPTITVPPFAAPNTAGYTASVPFKEGLTYKWEVENATSTSEADKHSIEFSTPGSGVVTLSCTVSNGLKTLSETKKVGIQSGLNVMVTGLPPEAGKIIRVVGPGVNKLVDRSELIPDCNPGTYIVQVEKPFVNVNGLNYSPWESMQTVEVGANMTAQVEVIFPQPVCIVQIPNAANGGKTTTPMEFVLIPAGEFRMGSGESAPLKLETPPHGVKIQRPFYMARTECTQAQWQAVQSMNPSQSVVHPMHPVDSVTWRMSQDFLILLNTKMKAENLGVEFALPSEAQWEYACRAGSGNQTYFFGTSDAELGLYAWFGPGTNDPNTEKSHPVASKLPNPWGLYDILGNAWEWCEDDGHADYTQAPETDAPWIDSPRGATRIARGGSYFDPSINMRSAMRHSLPIDATWVNHGFRLVLKAPPFNDPKFSNPASIIGNYGVPKDIYHGELRAVDRTKAYRLSMEALAYPKVPDSKTYIGVVEYDKDKNMIDCTHHMYIKGTTTTLAVDLLPGAMEVKLKDSTAWVAGDYNFQRRFIFWDWVASDGEVYKPETYSRHLSDYDLWEGVAAIDKTQHTIKLRKPWAGGLVKADTVLSQANASGTFKYCTLCVGDVPTLWTPYSGDMVGVDASGSNQMNQFCAATHYVQMLMLCNYKNGHGSSTSESLWFRNWTWEEIK